MGSAKTIRSSQSLFQSFPKPAFSGEGTSPVNVPLVSRGTPILRRMRILAPALILFSILVGGIGMHTSVESKAQPGPEETIAKVLADGGLFQASPNSFDQRALISERINALHQTPDVVVIGDGGWQFLRQDLRWERELFGAYIDTLKVSDIWAIIRQLVSANRLPKTIVLGVSPDFIITDPDHPTLVERVTRWLDPSPSGANDGGNRLSHAGKFRPADPEAVVTLHHAEFDTLFPDGSVIWSQDRVSADTSDDLSAAIDAIESRLKNTNGRARFRPIGALNSVIGHLKLAGVEVHLALSPMHPMVHSSLRGTPQMDIVDLGTELLLQTARTFDAGAVGSFEPGKAKCSAETFANLQIPGSACVARLIDQVIRPSGEPQDAIVLTLR